jgi:Protein of unknown function (DUF1153)
VRQKLLIVAAVRNGMLTFAEACERYNLDLEEFLAWQCSFEEVWPAREDRALSAVTCVSPMAREVDSVSATHLTDHARRRPNYLSPPSAS